MAEPAFQSPQDLELAFLHWNGLLFRYAYARVGNREDAEDVVQLAFEKAWKHRHTFDPKKSSQKTWLFTIVGNTTIDLLRSRRRKPEEAISDTHPAATNISHEVQHDVMVEWVYAQINGLPERDRELIFLRYREDYSFKEIAEVLKLQYSTAKVALHRALKKLKVLCNPEEM